MKRNLLFAVLAITGFLFGMASCQKAPELTLTSSSNIEFSADGSSGSITFTANRDWTAHANDSWVSVSPSSGAASDGAVTVTVRCNANTTYEDRSTTVTINMGDLSQTVTVKQPANKGIVLPKQVFDLQSDTRSIDVEVQANVQYSVSTSANWIKQVGTKALSSKTLSFSIEENKTYDSREGKITIKPTEGNVQEQVITVKQAGRIAVASVTLDKTSVKLKEGESITLVATVKPDNATDKTVTWISSNDSIATVDETGKVTAIKIGEATITAMAGEKTANCIVFVDKTVPTGAVDLGLSVCWSACNLGAEKPEDLGDYYAWGETEPKSGYSWSTYKWSNGYYSTLTKYNTTSSSGTVDNKTVLEPEDDVVHVKLGGKWRMPTDAEWTELRTKCTWTWTSNYNMTGVKGRIVTAPNGNSIFLPAAGGWIGARLDYAGSGGYYWSSSLNTDSPNSARIVFFNSDHALRSDYNRCYGLSVRPVTE